MPPIPTAFVQAAAPRLPYRFASASALVIALFAAPASAQDTTGETTEVLESAAKTTPPPTTAPLTGAERVVQFEAGEVAYDSNGESATATGNVVLRSEQRSVRADTVKWNRKTGLIVANGNVRLVDENGNQLYTDKLELTDTFEAGSMEDVLLALREGGRLAAVHGERMADGTVELDKAAYTGCPVENADGCPKKPSWRITSEKVLYDPKTSDVRFKGAYLELFGMRLLPMPGLSVRTDGSAVSGFLIPEIQFSENNGVQVSGKYYARLADNKDLEAKADLFTDAPPMISGSWRHLTDIGAYQITGYLTTSRRSTNATTGDTERDVRGYLFTNGRFQFDPNWSLDYSIRRASDRTFLRRYDISYDDRLRSLVKLERTGATSFFQLAGYATQSLRLNADQGQVPVALPLIDWRKRIDDPLLGGKIEIRGNSLALMRDAGQNTQRAFAGARWDLRRVTGMGQLVTLTGLVRGDVYHSTDNQLTDTALYRGNPGWETRGVALAALDIQWPFAGRAFGGTQVITPRLQFVASPPIRNLAVPNEDARAVDLEDSNLFALNRFPGYDRVEDGARMTYGVDYDLQFPDWRIRSTVGQSYRLSNQRTIVPDGTGLSEQVSDFVGRTEVRYKDFVKLTHRFRLDKDDLAVRRNELDATVGSSKTYLEVGYLRLNRDISSTIEDLRDREELRAATRIAFARYWSVFGSGVFNLTDREEDPTLTSSGFDPVRTRLGVAYEDECLELGLTWRRDYVDTGDARRGNTFQLYFALRGLGFR
ncbi:LPS-assembly protein LptD [Altererythrobacter sp. FM1]|uniref:LPS-assembly protein LptD n=1 Tax=Tsuneonella flava TaxID=2055955 RepID=UPI000C7FFD13|nr:LPS assembly protein LptD [Tsuneonella flava]ROT94926.1 LPS-assembly protein LptD [Altererythrobacter sp. FM1]